MTDDQEFSYDLKIPLERVAVLIGKEGETKKSLSRFIAFRIVIFIRCTATSARIRVMNF